MDVRMENSWKEQLIDEFGKEYFTKLAEFVKKSYTEKTCYPSPKFIFRAFEMCPFDKVKVVILGQDPYHGPGQANGLCFSVNDGITLPPSLVNIYKEIESDTGARPQTSGNLDRWAKQGVLLLNATLSVEAARAGSHQHKGWEIFTDRVIDMLSEKKDHLVFILWGRYAQEKGARIDTSKHLVIKSAHPSPLSAYNGFFGSRPFSSTNTYLQLHNDSPIDWN